MTSSSTKYPVWYDRERKAYEADKQMVTQYTDWLKTIPWQLFVTLKFSYNISSTLAEGKFKQFINILEKQCRAPIVYVRGSEQPHTNIHYHLLVASSADLFPGHIEKLWKQFGGNANSADARFYDPDLHAAEYTLKFINSSEKDWDFRHLDLGFAQAGVFNDDSEKSTPRSRRRLKRHEARMARANAI